MPTSYFSAATLSDATQKEQPSTRTPDYKDSSERIINTIDVQKIDVNTYISKELWQPVGTRGVFGGSIISQALRAAWNTVPEHFHIHSLHSYFILACDVKFPVLYSIQRIRDGRSFQTRSVTATQKGQTIFVATCSFTTISEAINAEHFTPMSKDVPEPESLQAEDDRVRHFLDRHKDISPDLRDLLEKRLEEPQPVIYKDIIFENNPVSMLRDKNLVAHSKNQRWFKSREMIKNDDPRIHAGILAYASDAGILGTAAFASGLRFGGDKIGMMASIDHSIWFHQPCRADDWLLYDMHSPRAANGRGIAFGRIYTRDGTLVATTAQEGVIRLSQKEQQRRKEQSTKAEKPASNSSRL